MDGLESLSASDVSAQFEFALGDELRGERATLGKTLLDVQRDLRIKASYISAIEDSDVSAFPNPSFVPGYIRSYARYLSLDPDQVYRRFCAESGFSHTPPASPKAKAAHRAAAAVGDVNFKLKYPLAEPRRGMLPEYPLSALGSLVVLVALVGGLGYGAWTLLQNIQRVQFAPVEDLPLAVAEVNPLEAPDTVVAPDALLADLASPVAAIDLADLYRQQDLEVPILSPRDGPIAAIDPDLVGPLAARAGRAAALRATAADPELSRAEILRAVSAVSPEDVIAAKVADSVAETAPETLVVIAERAAWIRVYLENGTVIFERILETGETYSPPAGIGSPLVWAGNAGSVYVRVGDSLHGPLGSGTRAVRDVVLEPTAIAARYTPVQNIPDVISQTIGLLSPPPAEAVAFR